MCLQWICDLRASCSDRKTIFNVETTLKWLVVTLNTSSLFIHPVLYGLSLTTLCIWMNKYELKHFQAHP